MRHVLIATALGLSLALSLCNFPVLGGLVILSLYVAALS